MVRTGRTRGHGAERTTAATGRAPDVVFVLGPSIGHPDRFEPLGLGYLAAALEHAGMSSLLLNVSARLYARRPDLYRRLYDAGSLERFWPAGHWGFGTGYVDDILSGRRDRTLARELAGAADGVLHAIRRLRPSVVGLSVVQSNIAFSVALGTRLVEAGLPTVAGGPGLWEPAVRARFAGRAAHVVVCGEAELSLPGICARLRSGPSPLGRIEAGRPPQNLAHLPWPRLGPGRLPAIPVLTSRGCTARCRFCEESNVLGRIRRRPVADVVEELVAQTARHGTRVLHFHDSLINHDREWLARFCRALARTLPGLRWDAYARPEGLDDALLAAMARSGCVQLFFGVEHLAQPVSDLLGKRLDVTAVADTIKRAASGGIAARLLLIEGVPGETGADHAVGLQRARELVAAGGGRVSVSVNPLLVVPSSVFGRNPGRYGIELHRSRAGEVTALRFRGGPSRARIRRWLEDYRGLVPPAP